ncbi:hypothetical protein [Vibrio agarivorans]|uniref:hypothetical protein n=1 Tax=Vibrio agarivorans TaxID=153622 RepID=UPI00222F4E18|nr:hypothetical protein [Vibrio agarivorans]
MTKPHTFKVRTPKPNKVRIGIGNIPLLGSRVRTIRTRFTKVQIFAMPTLLVVIATYTYFMFFDPILNPINEELGRWKNLMNTLYHWQSLNSSIIAFIAALIAVFISQSYLKREASAKRRAELFFLVECKAMIVVA